MITFNRILMIGAAALMCLALHKNAGAVPAESRVFTPYFNMNMAQGAYLPSRGDFFAGANVNANAGLLATVNPNHSIFGLYGLSFAGEGFRFQDTQEFASKDLTHSFNLEYRWQVLDSLRLRPGVSYGKTMTRTAANEVWGEGLYDSKSMGGQFALDQTFEIAGKRSGLTGQWLYRDVQFPNYTDIIREFQGLDANTELAGGLKDQTMNEFSFLFYWSKFHVRARYGTTQFKNEKVVQADGTYGTEKQADSRISFNTGFEGKLWIFEINPELTYSIHRSNQNFLLFKSVTDPSPIFASNYYNYSEMSLGVPLYLNFTQRWALNAGLEYKRRNYADRQPRDSSNQFIAGQTQSNNLATLSLGIRKKMNDISALSLTYTSVVASSNNTFERYLPYNYTGQGISIAYHITY